MLRVDTKNKLIRILDDVIALCKQGAEKDDTTLSSVLEDSQEAIIMISEYLEKEIENCTEVISYRDSLCESFFLLSQNLDSRGQYGSWINTLLNEMRSFIISLQACYRVVFFPYKADMWDSLESIWLASKEDPYCDCKVVPIPYYHFDATKNEWIYRYEIDRFPSYVPVINYKGFDLTDGVDAAFVHNPYDEYNNVTHIHSDYYSYNLKTYVNKLFYVPYYVTSGFIAQDHKMLSVYPNADYLVVQSESFKEGLREYTYYDKAIVMGSPKLDRVIRLSGNKEAVPVEWKAILEGKKSLMLNTSLHQFLSDGEAYLQKLAYLFDIVKAREDVVIIWRPHPLLQSTIESMRPHLLKTFLRLKDYFEREEIGVFDTTPDVVNTIAVANGYIGESSSSVVNLFQAAGKPLFILDNYIQGDFSEEDKRTLAFTDVEKVGDDCYITVFENNGIYISNISDVTSMKIKFNRNIGTKWVAQSNAIFCVEDNLYFSPSNAEEFYSFDMKESRMIKLSTIEDKSKRYCRFVTNYKNKLFYLPNVSKCIIEYDLNTRLWKEFPEPIKVLQKNINGRIYEDVCGYFVKENYIWMTTLYSNRILCFDMETGKYLIYEVGDISMCYSAIAVVNNMLYLADAKTGNIVCWNIQTKKIIANYSMPVNYKVYRNVQGRHYSHLRFWVVENNIITMPGTSNGVVKIDLRDGRSKILAKDFWSDVFETTNCYKYEAYGIATFAKMIDDDTLLIQKRRDASLLELNVHTGEYKIHHPKLARGELEKLLEGEDGFEKSYTNGEFARRESKYFSFEGFLDDLVNDRLGDAMDRQKKEMETMAVNLDGTCGEKVHEFMMKVLMQNEF